MIGIMVLTKRSFSSSHRQLLINAISGFLLLCIGCAPAYAAAKIELKIEPKFELKETLLPLKTVNLDFSPIAALIDDAQILVQGVENGGGTRLSVFNVSTLSEVATKSWPFTTQEMIFTADQQHIVLLGNPLAEIVKSSEIVILDRSLNVISRIETTERFISPASYASGDDKLYVYDRASRNAKTSGTGRAEAYLFDLSDRQNPALIETLSFPSHRDGVVDFWLLNGKAAVLNSAYSASLDVFEVPSGYPIDSLSYRFGKNSGYVEVQPFTALALADRPNCGRSVNENGWAATFVLISNATREIILAAYDSKFKSMEVTARAPVRVSKPGTTSISYIPKTDIPSPASMIAGACDLSIIWVADIVNKRISQYARNAESEVLETVGTLDVEFIPSAIALNDSGSFGVALSREQRKLSLFGENPVVQRSAAQSISGSSDVRTLQRLLTANGFQVGTIDGIYGKQTQRAIDLFETKFQVDLGAPGNLDRALEQIKAVTTSK